MSTSSASIIPAANLLRIKIILVLAAWLASVSMLAAAGLFDSPPGAPPLPVFGGVVLPLVAFFIALRTSPAFRDYVLTLDLRLIAAVQAWRFGGLGFIALYANGVLPGLFAWPAGVGDMAIAAFAPWWAVALAKDSGSAGSKRFLAWNVLGIADLVIAVGSATICALWFTGADAPSVGPMAKLPLILIPAFLVPLFIMLHISALMQSRRVRR